MQAKRVPEIRRVVFRKCQKKNHAAAKELSQTFYTKSAVKQSRCWRRAVLCEWISLECLALASLCLSHILVPCQTWCTRESSAVGFPFRHLSILLLVMSLHRRVGSGFIFNFLILILLVNKTDLSLASIWRYYTFYCYIRAV